MSLDNDVTPEEPKDYTKHIWIGVISIFVLMLAIIAFQGDLRPTNSEVASKHILIGFNKADPADRSRALKLIQEIRQRVVDGENFESLARQYSDDPGSGSQGGYIPPQRRGTFEENYEKFVWSAPIGELSDIIQTSYGFHLIVVESRYISDADEYEQELDQRVQEERHGGGKAPAAESKAE
tara:strand:- start:232 stop:774 length:543 start_codon:yes stop_codon:yes gene_type:complete